MIPVSNDFYAGMVSPSLVLIYPCSCEASLYPHSVKEYHVPFFESSSPWRLLAWSGQISSFQLLHVDTWLSLNQPMGKAGMGVFGHVKTGNSGRGSRGINGLDMLFDPTDVIWLNAWAHNMNPTNYDWHCGYELWIEDEGNF